MGQHNKNENRRAIVFASVLPVLFIGAIALVLWANDVRRDRKHSMTVEEPTAADTVALRASKSLACSEARCSQFAADAEITFLRG